MLFAAGFPAVSHDDTLLLLVQLAVVLATALLLGLIAKRFGLPMIVGELLGGVVLGPSLLGWVAPDLFRQLFPRNIERAYLINGIGQLGVVLLVGLGGMHVNLQLIRKQGLNAARVSIASLLVPLGLGIAIGYLLPTSLMADTDRLTFALFMGVALCVSALPVITKTLMDMGLMHNKTCQLALTASVIDDAFGWTMLSVISAMAVTGTSAGQIMWSACKVILMVVLMFTVGRKIINAIIRSVQKHGNGEGSMVTALAVLTLMSAAMSQALGLEALHGAFVCGMILSMHKEVRNIHLPTVLSILAPVFFVTAGLRMDLTGLADPGILIAALAVLAVAIIGKFAGAYLGARLSRLNRQDALILGACLNARGVIEVVVATIGMQLGILSLNAYTIIVLVAIVTSLMAPPVLRYATKHVR